MIGFLPELKEDELFYSFVARYYKESGYFAYQDAINDFFVKPKLTVSMERIDTLKPEVLKHLPVTLEELLYQHTLYNYYQIISPPSKTFYPSAKGKTYLKYCPYCEGYWHTKHQLLDIKTCYQHQCYLKVSQIPLSHRTNLYPLEEKEKEGEECKDKDELELTRYMVALFENPNINLSKIGLYFSTLTTSPKKLYREYQERFKEGMTENMFVRFLEGKPQSLYHICQVALMLNVSLEELEKEKPLSMFEEIALETNQPLEVVELIGNALLRKTKGKRENHYDRKDKELLPKVRKAIKTMYSNYQRPRRVCEYSVCRELGITNKKVFKNLPLCLEEIRKYQESMEEYWGREVTWAIEKLERENEPIAWRRIRNLINLKLENLISCIPYIKDERIQWIVEEMLKSTQ